MRQRDMLLAITRQDTTAIAEVVNTLGMFASQQRWINLMRRQRRYVPSARRAAWDRVMRSVHEWADAWATILCNNDTAAAERIRSGLVMRGWLSVSLESRRLAGRRRRYANHIGSPRWALMREFMLDLAHYRCELCGATEPPPVYVYRALQVHHLSYARTGMERLNDLVVLCKPCHGVIHMVVGTRAVADCAMNPADIRRLPKVAAVWPTTRVAATAKGLLSVGYEVGISALEDDDDRHYHWWRGSWRWPASVRHVLLPWLRASRCRAEGRLRVLSSGSTTRVSGRSENAQTLGRVLGSNFISEVG